MEPTSPQVLTFAGRRYVVVPEREYERMGAALEDAAGLAAVERFSEKLAAGEEELVPFEITERVIAGENPVRVWREHRGMSAVQLAERAGISRGYLSQIETGAREGTISTIAAIARALDLDIADLVASTAAPPRADRR